MIAIHALLIYLSDTLNLIPFRDKSIVPLVIRLPICWLLHFFFRPFQICRPWLHGNKMISSDKNFLIFPNNYINQNWFSAIIIDSEVVVLWVENTTS